MRPRLLRRGRDVHGVQQPRVVEGLVPDHPLRSWPDDHLGPLRPGQDASLEVECAEAGDRHLRRHRPDALPGHGSSVAVQPLLSQDPGQHVGQVQPDQQGPLSAAHTLRGHRPVQRAVLRQRGVAPPAGVHLHHHVPHLARSELPLPEEGGLGHREGLGPPGRSGLPRQHVRLAVRGPLHRHRRAVPDALPLLRAPQRQGVAARRAGDPLRQHGAQGHDGDRHPRADPVHRWLLRYPELGPLGGSAEVPAGTLPEAVEVHPGQVPARCLVVERSGPDAEPGPQHERGHPQGRRAPARVGGDGARGLRLHRVRDEAVAAPLREPPRLPRVLPPDPGSLLDAPLRCEPLRPGQSEFAGQGHHHLRAVAVLLPLRLGLHRHVPLGVPALSARCGHALDGEHTLGPAAGGLRHEQDGPQQRAHALDDERP
mmetsp:Transcript_45553/g.145285  ORF Transcript_45553/g.145285 Transcript_45553/m.145285 type:complete len:426 (+) Transcript_45553:3284-4561(+)